MSSALLLKIHLVSVTVFLVFYLLKTFFLLTGKMPALERWTKNTRIAEMIFSSLFFISGVWLFVIIGDIKTMQLVKLALVFSSIPIAVIGFKKKNRIMATTSFIFLISAYGISEASRAKPFPAKHADMKWMADRLAAGKYIFEKNCSQCHGTDGKKMYREAADLSLSVTSASMTETIIRNGSNKKMPAYNGVLSEEEIQSVAEFIMTLRAS